MVTLDALNMELAEIDENLRRNELTVLERAEHLARRKEIYEALHPETKAGVAQAKGMNRAVGNNVNEIISPTFSASTAETIGQSKRTVEQEVQIATNLTDTTKIYLVDSPTADNKTDLLRLARMKPALQEVVAERLAAGTAANVADAQRQLQREETAELSKVVEAPTGKYRTIVLDPPWTSEDSNCNDPIGRGQPNYNLTSIEDMIADDRYNAGLLAEPGDCHLYMWVTNAGEENQWNFSPVGSVCVYDVSLKSMRMLSLETSFFVWDKPNGLQHFGNRIQKYILRYISVHNTPT